MALTLSRYLFLLLVFSLPLVRPFNTIVFGYPTPYTDFVFLASALFFVVALARGETSLRMDRIYLAIAVYAFALTISAIFSIDVGASFKKLIGEYYLFALCILTFNLVDERFFKQVLIAWLAGTAITVCASIAGFVFFYLGFNTEATNYVLSHFGSLPAGNYPRIHALFANANMLCNYLNVSVMLALLGTRVGWIKPIVSKIFFFGIAFAALFSISPGLGGIALSSGIWFWAMHSKGGRALLAAGILASVVMLAATLVSPDTKNTDQDFVIASRTIEPSVRVLVWEDTLTRLREHPILGRGTGLNVAEVRYEVLSGDKQMLGDAHNMWLSILGQAGVVGLAVFLFLCFYLWQRCNFSDKSRPILIALSCALTGAFFYQGLTGSFEDARHLWVLIGLLAAVSSSGFTFQGIDISPASKVP